MKKNTEPMFPDTYYHVYNRGINGTRIFTKKGNTDYFLKKYLQYIEPIATTFAYVLMGNHFHFFIKTKSEAEILEWKNTSNVGSGNVGRVQNPANVNIPKTASFIISKQFSNLFNTYAQAINKQDQRTGGLFEEPFRRILVENDSYAAHLVYYIHHNPTKHGFIDDFRAYQHSSYALFLNDAPTFIPREEVFLWFGGKEAFLIYHDAAHEIDEKWYDKNWYEAS